jgi:mono/diheme cytochrome c family protein
MDQKQSAKRASAMRWRVALFGMVGFVTMIMFQNCDGGFHYDPANGSLSSASSGVGSELFRLTTYSPANLVVPEGQSFEGGVDYKLVASGSQVSTATILWSLLNNTGGCVIKSGTGPETRYVYCDKSGRVTIQSTAIWTDGTTTVLASDRTTAALIVDACGASNSIRTVFRIPNGTGAAAWNTMGSPVAIPVGMTLRICNDDTTASHQLMTTGGSPCASQAAPMAKGAFYDCVIANANNVSPTNGTFNGMYDAIAGTNAAFYVRPYNGVALYADTTKSSNGQSCASCHRAFANSEKKGASASGITAAIANNSGGMGVFNGRLTAEEIRAISFSLNQ